MYCYFHFLYLSKTLPQTRGALGESGRVEVQCWGVALHSLCQRSIALGTLVIHIAISSHILKFVRPCMTSIHVFSILLGHFLLWSGFSHKLSKIMWANGWHHRKDVFLTFLSAWSIPSRSRGLYAFLCRAFLKVAGILGSFESGSPSESVLISG